MNENCSILCFVSFIYDSKLISLSQPIKIEQVETYAYNKRKETG